jgi:radical SAM protein with 4Fe4S-binding SPASM domain
MTCSAPWRGLHIRTNGDILTCCAGATSLGNIHTDKLEDALNGKVIKEVRQSIKDGKLHKEYCKNCIAITKQNVRCELDWHNDINNDFKLEEVDLNYTYPTLFDARWNNTCNSNCIYCDETQSSKWAVLKKSPAFVKNIKNKEYLTNFFEGHKDHWRTISLVGGEPLMIKENMMILDNCAKDVPITVITNLSSDLSTSKVFEKLMTFDTVGWHLSFDNVEEHYEYVRQGSNWQVFNNNLKTLGDAIGNIPNCKHYLKIMSVLNLLNITHLDSLKKFSKKIVSDYLPTGWPTESIEIVWQPCLMPHEISLTHFGSDFVAVFKEFITNYLEQGIQDNEKIFFTTILEQLDSSMQQPTSEKQKDMLNKWIQMNADYFNNQGAFAKLYPEFSKLL